MGGTNMQTNRDRIIAYLTAQGCVSVPCRTTKYVAYRNSKYTFFIGRNGAVRVSSAGTLSTAASITDIMMQRVITWEKQQQDKQVSL